MEERTFSFSVKKGLLLILENLFAIVTVRAGNDNVVTIKVVGDKKNAKDINVSQKDAQKISVEGRVRERADFISRGRGSSFSFSGGTFIDCTVGNGNTVVNGSRFRHSVADKAAEITTRIEIVVPKETSIDISQVHDAKIIVN